MADMNEIVRQSYSECPAPEQIVFFERSIFQSIDNSAKRVIRSMKRLFGILDELDATRLSRRIQRRRMVNRRRGRRPRFCMAR